MEIKPGETLNRICDFDSPPAQDQAPPAPTSAAPAAPAAPADTAGSPKQTVRETVDQTTSASPKQTERETVPQAAAASGQQDLEAQAGQMEAQAQTIAAQAQADAMARMQAAMTQMQGNQLPQQQTPAQQAQASAQAAREESGGQYVGTVQPPKQTVSPQTAGAGAHMDPNQVGARPSEVDYSNVGAVDTGGGLDGVDENPEQGHNPYEGMSEREMQAAFARDMSMQERPDGVYDKTDWQLGKAYPLQCKRYEDTLNNRLNTYAEKARGMGRADVLERIKVARANLGTLAQQRKQRVPRDVLQQTLDHSVQEVHAIEATLGMR